MAEAPTNPRSPGQDALCRFLVKSGDGCLGVRPVKQTGAPASDSGARNRACELRRWTCGR